MLKIPVSRPAVGESEEKFVMDALRKGEISGSFGNYINDFEKGFADYCGVKYGVSVANGTVALHLALATLGIKAGDEVIVSTFTNMATCFAILYQGAAAVPIDIEPDTWNIDPTLIETKITSRTKAIMVVHIYGHPVDMDPVLAIAKKHKLFVVEDCAEAHGAEYKGKKVGSLSDISCFSFYANKIITTGEGGMLMTNSRELADKARSLKALAFGKENKFMHQDIGFNYRLTNLQAALGYAQLQKIDSIIAKKRELADFYLKNLEYIEGLQLPIEKEYAKNVYWMFLVVLRGNLTGKRSLIMEGLKKREIETREAFVPFNMQKIFIEKGLARKEDCPLANYVAENGFYIPSGPILTEEEKNYVVRSVREVCNEFS